MDIGLSMSTNPHCEASIHMRDDGVLMEEITPVVEVKYLDDAFGGEDRKLLCEECLTRFWDKSGYAVVMETIRLTNYVS